MPDIAVVDRLSRYKTLARALPDSIVGSDRKAFGADRSFLLKSLHDNEPEFTMEIRKNDERQSFTLGHRGLFADHLGPWMARTSSAARHLLEAFLARSTRESLVVDCLKANNVAVCLLKSCGFTNPLADSCVPRFERLPGLAGHAVLNSGPRIRMMKPQEMRIFYGWWVVGAAFLNLFFVVGIIFYGFPVFYPAFIESLRFSRSQVTQGFFLGMLIVGLPSGLLAGGLIDRIGARWVIFTGVGLTGVSLLLMGSMTRFWHYELLCIMEVLGFVLAGPIANQVLVARWFRKLRGRAMGYAYLGLGLGGVVAPPLITFLIQAFGWRHALEIVGLLILLVLFPVGIWITRSSPAELGLLPDGARFPEEKSGVALTPTMAVTAAVRSKNFWLIVVGSALVVGAIGAVIQHFILFLRDQGFSRSVSSQFLSVLLASSLAGRVLVGYMADRFSKKNIMALFYLLIGAAVLLLGVAHGPVVLWIFTVAFGFSMGADYMLIPLVVAECFGTASLGKLLALIIMGYSLGQWGAPWMVGKLFDAQHSYDLAWRIMAVGALVGAGAVYAVSNPSKIRR